MNTIHILSVLNFKEWESESRKVICIHVYKLVFFSSLPLCMNPAGKWIYLLEMCYCCYVIVSFMFFFLVVAVFFFFFSFLSLCCSQNFARFFCHCHCHCCVELCCFFLLILHFHLIFIYLFICVCLHVCVFCVYECVHNRCYLFLLTHSICKILYSFWCARFCSEKHIQTLARARSRANRTTAASAASTSLNSHKFFSP